MIDTVVATAIHRATLSESLSMIDTVNTVAVFTPTLTESLSMNDTVDTDAVFTPTLSESLSMNDQIVATATHRSTLSESLSMIDTVNTVAVFTPTLTESLSMNDTVVATATHRSTLSESLSMNDTVDTDAVFTPTLTESLSMNDTVDTDAVFTPTLSESLSMNDTVVATATHRATLSESLSMNDTLDRFLPGVPSAEVSLTGWILNGCSLGNSNTCLDETPGSNDGISTMISVTGITSATSRYDIDDFGIPSTNIIDSVILRVFAAVDATGGIGNANVTLNVFGSSTTSCEKTITLTSFNEFTCDVTSSQNWIPANFDGQTTDIGVDNAGDNENKIRQVSAMYLEVIHHTHATLSESLSMNDTVNTVAAFTTTLTESLSMNDTVNTDATVFTVSFMERDSDSVA